MRLFAKLLLVMLIISSGYWYLSQESEEVVIPHQPHQPLRVKLDDLRPDWPQVASPQAPSVLINDIALYPNLITELIRKTTRESDGLQLFTEVIFTELCRQSLLADRQLTSADQARLKPPPQSPHQPAGDWLLETRAVIRDILAREALAQVRYQAEPSPPALADFTARSPQRVRVAFIEIIDTSTTRLERRAAERRAHDLYQRIVKHQLLFTQAQRIHSSPAHRQTKSLIIAKGQPRADLGLDLSTSALDRLFSSRVGEVIEPIRLDHSLVILKILEHQMPIDDPKYALRKERVAQQKAYISHQKRLLIEAALREADLKIPLQATQKATSINPINSAPAQPSSPPIDISTSSSPISYLSLNLSLPSN